MKKIFVVLALLAGSMSFVMAQDVEFKPFRVDAGVGYAIPFTEGLDGGVSMYLEPKYEIVPQIALGLRWEGAFLAGASDDELGIKGKVQLNSSYLLTGDYYLNNNKFRPFVGLGLGFYQIAGASADLSFDLEDFGSVDAGVADKTNFGGMLRAGFDASHFRLTVSYNYGGKVFDETYSYLGISLGFYIGGGKK